MPEAAARELSFAQAVREALAEEMRRDSRVCILGEDVAEAGTPFKVLSGLVTTLPCRSSAVSWKWYALFALRPVRLNEC